MKKDVNLFGLFIYEFIKVHKLEIRDKKLGYQETIPFKAGGDKGEVVFVFRPHPNPPQLWGGRV